ncbi:MAG TPA: hypothetical protein VF187_03415 [Gemmatimonadales bacterium]
MSRQVVGLAGIAMALLGIALGSRVVIWVAIGVLTVALAWRLIARKRGERNTDE